MVALAGVASLAGTLFVGASLARAAESAPDAGQTPQSSTAALVSAAPATATPVTTTGVAAGDASTASVPTGSSGAVQQTIGMTVLPGTMTVAPASESVALSQVTLGGPQPLFTGSVTPVTVNDYRGSLAGWKATVTVQSVTGVSAAALARARVCLGPHDPTLVEGNPADVVRGAGRSCGPAAQPLTVFFAAAGGGGGTYRDSADLALDLPSGTPLSGPATATLTVAAG